MNELVVAMDDTHMGYGEVVNSRELACEMALLELQARQKSCTVAELLGRQVYHSKIAITRMFETLGPHSIAEAQQALKAGYRTLKYKVGALDDALYLQDIRVSIGPEIDIRLDANQNFSLQEAIDFGKRVASLRIAYFEEPVQNPLDIPKFAEATGIGVALDETLLFPLPLRERVGVRGAGVTTFALKPFMFANIASFMSLIEYAEKNNIEVAICTCFETGLGLNWLARLASTIKKPVSAGLSAFEWFEEDLITPAFRAQDGFVTPSSSTVMLSNPF